MSQSSGGCGWKGSPQRECVSVPLDLCWTCFICTCPRPRGIPVPFGIQPHWLGSFVPASCSPAFGLAQASGGLWCSLATPSPGSFSRQCCFKEKDSYRSPPSTTLGSRSWPIQNGQDTLRHRKLSQLPVSTAGTTEWNWPG